MCMNKKMPLQDTLMFMHLTAASSFIKCEFGRAVGTCALCWMISDATCMLENPDLSHH